MPSIVRLENFEVLLGMVISFDILFAINSVSKNFQNEDMHINVALDEFKCLISYFKNYRRNEFTSAMIFVKEIDNCIEIESQFHEIVRFVGRNTLMGMLIAIR